MTGKFISIEGGEGAGKSTQIAFLAERLRARNIDIDITREPGGTEGAEAIRQLLLNGSNDRWAARSEAMLFAAARSDHVEKRIRPALASGKWVICDRFIDSSRAYQGISLALSDAIIMQLHAIGSNGMLPDRTIILDVCVETSRIRTSLRDHGASDRIGGRDTDFHNHVRQAFCDIAANEPQRVRLIDAEGDPAAVADRVFDAVFDLIP